MNGRVLVDTGPIVAIFKEEDEHHSECVGQLRSLPVPLLTCWPVITEAAWILRGVPSGVSRLLTAFREGLLQFAELRESDLAEITVILGKYRSSGLQLADAALLHLANREGIETIFTLDRRDFTVVRLNRGRHLRLLP